MDTLETTKDVKRRIKALIEDMRDFFNKHNAPLDEDQAYNLLNSFLRKNIEPLIEYINPASTHDALPIKYPEGYDILLIEYFKAVEQQKPENYKTFYEMVLGSVISVIIYTKEPSDIDGLRRKKFRPRQIFLDTNFIFSVLDLHPREFSTPAKELFRLLKEYDFEIKVLSTTLDEISKVVSGYSEEVHRYPTTIRVDTLYSSLKIKGWSKIDAQKFIMDLENIVQDKGIKIEWIDVNLETYQPTDSGLKNLMEKYKPLQKPFHQNHDLVAIEKIKTIRGRSVRRIEDSKACFLTSDVRLSKFNFTEMGHKRNGTVCEVISDRLLTNILWLKNPNLKVSLNSIIAAHSRGLFIKRQVWERFYDALYKLRREEKVKDEDITNLFYKGYLEEVLKEFDVDEVDKITEGFVIDEVEKAAKVKERKIQSLEASKDKEIERKENELKMLFKEEISKIGKEKDKKWLEKIKESKSSLKVSAEKEASRSSTVYTLLLTLLVLGVSYGIYLIFGKEQIEHLVLSLNIIFGGGFIIPLWIYFRPFLKRKLIDRIFTQKLKEAKLDDYKIEDTE